MNPIVHQLQLVHHRLEAEIRREMKARWVNGPRVLRLKKLRLAIKDRLHLLARRAPRAA